MYALGIDLGTTFTAAATWRDGRAEIAALGSRAAAIPSVVLLRQDETFLIGETANRRALTEPDRVAREFKRRLGDPTPILLGGVPYSAEALTARLLRSVIDEVAAREGGQSAAICVSHPANWGPYKTDLLRQAVRLANLDQPVTFTTEPEAAAASYAQQQRIEPGAIVAVYDLGGGTFDAAVLRKGRAGFEILGQPEGIERLGGIDFDAAVFNHVSRVLGSKLAELDEDEPAAIAAVGRLREECTAAKEALSADTDTTIPVLLPNVSTEVRLTRSELEAMVRPALYDSIEALKRALRSAGVTADQLLSVLLVGGSSRMPIVAQLVGAEVGRPVAVDAHPKHAVALGAAWVASGLAAGAAAQGPTPAQPVPPPPARPARSDQPAPPPVRPARSDRPGPPPVADPVPPARSAQPPAAFSAQPPAAFSALPPAAPRRSADLPPPARPDRSDRPDRPDQPVPPARPDRSGRPGPPPVAGPVPPAARSAQPPVVPPRRSADLPPPTRPAPPPTRRPAASPPPRRPAATPPAGVPAARSADYPRGNAARTRRVPGDDDAATQLMSRSGGSGGGRAGGSGGGSGGRSGPAARSGKPRRRRGSVLLFVLGLIILAVIGTAGGVALAKRADSRDEAGGGAGSGSTTGVRSQTTAPSGTDANNANPTPTIPPDEQCTDQIKQNKRWVCLTKATFDGERITIDYRANFAGVKPNINGGFHLHIYGTDDTGTNPPDSVEGSQSSTPGSWYVEDQNPSVKLATSQAFRQAIGPDATKVCARIASSHHALVPDANGTFKTGNCIPINRI